MDHRFLLVPAIGLIVCAVALEWWFATRQGRVRSVAVMIGNGWMALFEQAAGLLVYVGLVGVYAGVSTWSPVVWPDAWWTWCVALILVDAAFYTYHRFCHSTSFGWALHAVHHQSPQLDFSAALRNSPFGGAVQFLFHVPLALIGLPVGPWLVAKTLNPVWQLCLHTETIDRVGPLEGWFNTPSAHRVHHGCQEAYQDRNLGGMFVVWDRLFGTYTQETEPPRYGTEPSLGTLDPVMAQWGPVADLFEAVGREGWGVLLRHPQEPPSRKQTALPRPSSMPLAVAGVGFLVGAACLVGLAVEVVPVWLGVPVLLLGGSVSAWVMR